MEDYPSKKMVFSYQKTRLYMSCCLGVFLTAFSVYVITRDVTQKVTIILASMAAIISLWLTLQYAARTQEKIILTDNSIQWIRLWKTIEFPLTKISGLEPYLSSAGTGLEVKAQTGERIRFTTDIIGFWALSRELKNHLFVA